MLNEKNCIASMRSIYKALQDEESKRIFEFRLNYFITRNIKYLEEMDAYLDALSKTRKEHKALDDIITEGRSGEGAVLYGAGRDSRDILSAVRDAGIEVCFICDKSKRKLGDRHLGLPVISPDELLAEHLSRPVIIASSYYARSIYLELTKKGIPKRNIYFPLGHPLFSYSIGAPEQYFGEAFISYGEDEVYIDAGCCDGATIIKFIGYCGDNYKKIVGFEPDFENFGITCETVSELQRVEIIRKGAWNCEDTLKLFSEEFNGEVRGNSMISDAGQITVETTSIDHVTRGEGATFINMDIEGAELKALMGVSETITQYRPKLAICVYHKPEDILEIPMYIHSLVPEYRFYLRHYGLTGTYWGTVLYAVI